MLNIGEREDADLSYESLLIGFYGISTVLVYLMPGSFLYIYRCVICELTFSS